jgi:hypothetical protein
MARTTIKPSDRGRDNPEPGPPPGARAEQRGTIEQLEDAPDVEDPAVEWERSEQERLPLRGAGSQHNQGETKEPVIGELGLHEEPAAREESPEAMRIVPGLQSGGTRGPSNQGR